MMTRATTGIAKEAAQPAEVGRRQETNVGVSESDDRRIVISGAINETIAAMTINALLKFEQKNPTEPILMVLDSYGGYIDSMFAIIDTMELVRCDVVTLCVGKAMSAGAVILLSGTKGKRLITPHARVMLHQISSFTFGRIADMDNDIKESKRLQDEVSKLIASKTKLGGRKLQQMLGKDYYLTAKEAAKYGIVDKLITRFPRRGTP